MIFNKVYCTRCRKGLHNVYKWKGKNEVETISIRCQGSESGKTKAGAVKCECTCQNHYLVNGYLVPLGEAPPEHVIHPIKKRELPPLDPAIEMVNLQAKKNREQREASLQQNAHLGVMGDDDILVKSEPTPGIMTEYATQSALIDHLMGRIKNEK